MERAWQWGNEEGFDVSRMSDDCICFGKSFDSRESHNTVLLVGEHDFSFAVTYYLKTGRSNVVATEFKVNVVYDKNILKNMKYLIQREVTVILGFDAKNIATYIPESFKFIRIQFNCPWMPNKDPNDPYNRPETVELVHQFMISAEKCCTDEGLIIVSIQSPLHWYWQYREGKKRWVWGRGEYQKKWGLTPQFIHSKLGLHFVGMERNFVELCSLDEDPFPGFLKYKPDVRSCDVGTFSALAFSKTVFYDIFDLFPTV